VIYSVAWTESPAPLPPASPQGFRPIECLGSLHGVSKWLQFERSSSGAPMLLADLVLLLVGFAAGYGVREFVSRRRRAESRRKYHEREEIEEILYKQHLAQRREKSSSELSEPALRPENDRPSAA
jgi:hypothetical protein